MGLKLKKGGASSTPSPTRKIDFQTSSTSNTPNRNSFFSKTKSSTSCVSARKLAAFLWKSLPPHTATMSHAGARVPSRLRRRKGKPKGKALEVHAQPTLDIPFEEPPSDSSLKREIAASVIQHHHSVERNSRAKQPVTPASYTDSIEVTPFNALSSRSFLGVEGKSGNSHFNLQTSEELVAVLNRIWSLEEQHASNISLVNSMKRELEQSQKQIKDLVREKKKEQERVKATIKSMREELEDERKLRKQSESLHKKLARELFDTRTSFAECLKECERERKERILLEDLCDEFATGIRDYEEEVRQLKQKPKKEFNIDRESPDKLILHLSEAWLDERMQMKKENQTMGTIVDKLNVEIETFLRTKAAKHSLGEDKLSIKKPTGRSLRRHTPQSLQLIEATSAPHDDKEEEEDDSTCSHSNFVQSHLKEKLKLKPKKKLSSHKKQGKVEGVEDPRVNSKHVLDDKVKRNQILSLNEETSRGNNEVLGATTKRARGLKVSTLKAQLLEARLEDQH